MLFCNVSHLETSSLNILNLVQFMVPHSNDFTSNLEALLIVLYCWETIPLTDVTLFTCRQLVLLTLPQSTNNANDVGHTNGDLHAANVGNNQGFDNNGDQALM